MIDAKLINPTRDKVVIKMLKLDEIYDTLITQAQSKEEEIATRYGEVLSLGPDVDKHGSCKNLKIGDTVIFTEFAGYYIPTDSDLVKIMRGYDIICKTKDVKDFSKLEPTENRILLEVVNPDSMQDIILADNKDPRLADLSYGKVLKTGPTTELNLSPGDFIAFPPFAGITVRHYESEENKELKTVLEFDILFTVKQ